MSLNTFTDLPRTFSATLSVHSQASRLVDFWHHVIKVSSGEVFRLRKFIGEEDDDLVIVEGVHSFLEKLLASLVSPRCVATGARDEPAQNSLLIATSVQSVIVPAFSGVTSRRIWDSTPIGGDRNRKTKEKPNHERSEH